MASSNSFSWAESVEFTAADHIAPLPIIYWTIVTSVLLTIAALPLLRIDVSVKSPGTLKPSIGMTEIKFSSLGIVKSVLTRENAMVKKGEMLVEVRLPLLEEKERYLQERLDELARFAGDAKRLINHADVSPETQFYRQVYADYNQRLADRQTHFRKAQQDYERNHKLFVQQVIPTAEFETFKFEYDNARNEVAVLRQNQRTAWQKELRNYQQEVSDCRNQLALVKMEQQSLNVIAPIDGTIQGLLGIYPGSFVFAGQQLAQISPEAHLIAEVYVSPGDIGLLKHGIPARLQVDAFDYHQWGLLSATINEISADVHVINNQPVFKVTCDLQADHLSLQNSYQGKLRKGMTIQARFVVARRSLWQLLFDKTADWVDPNR